MTRERKTDEALPPSAKSSSRSSRAFLIGVALVVGVAGPSISSPHDRAAGAPLVYEPPSTFHESPVTPSSAGSTPDKLWLMELPRPYKPRISLSHSPDKTALVDTKLAQVAHEMPTIFRNSGITWSELHHASRPRADGADVGLIYGDAKRDSDDVSFRTLQIAFPDDTGTTIVTASYSPEDVSALEPPLLESVDHASGVAMRKARPPVWMHLAWGIGAFVLLLLGSSILERKKPERAA